MQYIVTNFAYGTGPYLRTTELAIAVNREREARGRSRLGVIVPWVYGEKQKKIMLEEFGGHDADHPGEILLDAKLGALLASVFYGDSTYEEALRLWVEQSARIGRGAHEHLRGAIEVETLGGERRSIRGSEIIIELARAPRIAYGVAPVFSVTFGHISEILEHALEARQEKIAANRDLVRRALPLAQAMEAQAAFHGLAEPGTFSYLEGRRPRYPVEVAIPPTITPPRLNDDPIAEGIYVTITGIPGLERLYREAGVIGLKLYSNDPKAVPGAERLLPRVIPNPRIKLQFARSGWGSVWLSQLSGTPLVTPDFDPKDDPEIYFNNICIEALGLGIIYRGQPLAEILDEAERLRPGIRAFNQRLLERFGTFDGNAYASRHTVERLPA